MGDGGDARWATRPRENALPGIPLSIREAPKYPMYVDANLGSPWGNTAF